jgi:predicted transcriptional regulator
MIAKQLSTDFASVVDMNNTGSDVLYLMDEDKLSMLPVVNNENYVGLITEAMVFNMKDPDKPLAQNKIPYQHVYVKENQHIYEVIKMMSTENVPLLPVLDDKDRYKGCISIQTLIKHMGNFTAVSNPGAIILLELNQNDYVLSQIAQIVESNDAKILSLYVTSDINSTKMEVTIKVSKMEIQSIIQAFNRYNYIIKATYTEDEEMYNDLRDRYDSLMNYLNI